MKKWTKRVLVTVLSAAFLLGSVGTAWATEPTATPTRDTNSGFTTGITSGKTPDANVNATNNGTNGSFYLIKDYDSLNDTKESANSTQGAPYSSSPEETFTYKIRPYWVWNAGSTYSDTGTGTATPITKDNMPMLQKTASLNDDGITSSSGTKELTVTQAVGVNAALNNTSDANAYDAKTAIYLPEYKTVGDYWYEVEELEGNTVGVFYGTNSAVNLTTGDTTTTTTASNGGHLRKYYIHVQVTETHITGDGSNNTNLVSNVTLHKTAPNTSWNDSQYNDNSTGEVAKYQSTDKVNAIQNRYYAGDLVIKKEVTGNDGDKSQYFEVTVVFTKPANTIVNSDITFTAALKSTDNNGKDVYNDTLVTIKGQYSNETETTSLLRWKQGTSTTVADLSYTNSTTATATFYVKDDSTVTFNNIPYGITYTVQEALPANDNYKNELKFTSSSQDSSTNFDGINLSASSDTDSEALSAAATKKAKGSITDPSDEITITNEKTTTIDIGVITENAPFIALLAVSGAALFLLVNRKKKLPEV